MTLNFWTSCPSAGISKPTHVYLPMALGIKPRPLCRLDRDSTNWAISQHRLFPFDFWLLRLVSFLVFLVSILMIAGAERGWDKRVIPKTTSVTRLKKGGLETAAYHQVPGARSKHSPPPLISIAFFGKYFEIITSKLYVRRAVKAHAFNPST